MKILVTGATGFIGNHLVNTLLSQQHTVIATSSKTHNAERLNWFSQVKYVEYDILHSSDQDHLFSLFHEPDIVIHLAWGSVTDCLALAHVEDYMMPHYHFLKNLIQTGAKKITVSGTCLEYGMREGCLTTDLLADPQTPYALAKDTLRKLLATLQQSNNFELQWLRLFYMYGEGQHPKSLFAQLHQAITKQEPTFNMSGGEQIRDYLPVEEVAQKIALLGLSDQKGILNCCSGQPISVKNLVEQQLQKANAQLQLNLGFYPYKSYEPMCFWGKMDTHD